MALDKYIDKKYKNITTSTIEITEDMYSGRYPFSVPVIPVHF